MPLKLNRRCFIARTVMASAGVAAAANAADNTNPADQAAAKKAAVPAAAAAMPTGKIGKLTVSRLVSGGNLISGWAHSRVVDRVQGSGGRRDPARVGFPLCVRKRGGFHLRGHVRFPGGAEC